MSEEESDFLVLFVSHEFAVAGASFLPLLVAQAVQLATHLEDALFVLFTSDSGDFGEVNLSRGLGD